MMDLLKNNLGRFRILGFLEGLSLIVLVFIAVPLKYYGDNPKWVEVIGPIHGVLFIFYVILAFVVAAELKWKLFGTTWKVLLASIIPFGSFYVDKAILSKAN